MIIIKLHPIIKQIIKDRELDINELTKLDVKNLPPPNLIPNIDKLEKRLKIASNWGDKVLIVSDYDVDGCTSSAIMSKVLDKLNVNYDVYITDRNIEGYGIQKETINNNLDYDLYITLDNGITAMEQIEYANSLGKDVIVIDHHLPDNETPDCLILDLKYKQGKFPMSELSAGGLCWYIAWYFLGDEAFELIDIVALSTIADLVPLNEQINRIIVKEGLEKMNNNPNIGIECLIEILKEEKRKKGKKLKKIKEGIVGFYIAPLINAVQRILGTNELGHKLLTTNNFDTGIEISKKMDKLNKKRKELNEKAVKKAKKELKDGKNISIVKMKIGHGIGGLVANDIVQETKKPAIVITEHNSGSMRSLKPLSAKKLINEHMELLESGGGHSAAAGLKIKEGKFEEFKKVIEKYVEGIEYDYINYDLELCPTKIDMFLIASLKEIEPFGIGFSSPKFIFDTTNITNLTLFSRNRFTKFKWHGVDCVYWSDNIDDIRNAKQLVYSPGWSDYDNDIQLTIKEIIK